MKEIVGVHVVYIFNQKQYVPSAFKILDVRVKMGCFPVRDNPQQRPRQNCYWQAKACVGVQYREMQLHFSYQQLCCPVPRPLG